MEAVQSHRSGRRATSNAHSKSLGILEHNDEDFKKVYRIPTERSASLVNIPDFLDPKNRQNSYNQAAPEFTLRTFKSEVRDSSSPNLRSVRNDNPDLPKRAFSRPPTGGLPSERIMWPEKVLDTIDMKAEYMSHRDLVQRARCVLFSDDLHFLNPYQLDTTLAKPFVSLVFIGQITMPHMLNTANEMLNDPLSPQGRATLSHFLDLRFSTIGAVASAIGTVGMISLWWRRRHDNFWLVTNLFLPGLERSLYALLYAFIHAYATGTGQLSLQAQVTMIILAVSVLFCGLMACVYYNVDKSRRRAM